ncbi:hypothetical protein Q5752_001070 [Cryptotrichosporon argae]
MTYLPDAYRQPPDELKGLVELCREPHSCTLTRDEVLSCAPASANVSGASVSLDAAAWRVLSAKRANDTTMDLLGKAYDASAGYTAFVATGSGHSEASDQALYAAVDTGGFGDYGLPVAEGARLRRP